MNTNLIKLYTSEFNVMPRLLILDFFEYLGFSFEEIHFKENTYIQQVPAFLEIFVFDRVSVPFSINPYSEDNYRRIYIVSDGYAFRENFSSLHTLVFSSNNLKEFLQQLLNLIVKIIMEYRLITGKNVGLFGMDPELFIQDAFLLLERYMDSHVLSSHYFHGSFSFQNSSTHCFSGSSSVWKHAGLCDDARKSLWGFSSFLSDISIGEYFHDDDISIIEYRRFQEKVQKMGFWSFVLQNLGLWQMSRYDPYESQEQFTKMYMDVGLSEALSASASLLVQYIMADFSLIQGYFQKLFVQKPDDFLGQYFYTKLLLFSSRFGENKKSIDSLKLFSCQFSKQLDYFVQKSFQRPLLFYEYEMLEKYFDLFHCVLQMNEHILFLMESSTIEGLSFLMNRASSVLLLEKDSDCVDVGKIKKYQRSVMEKGISNFK